MTIRSPKEIFYGRRSTDIRVPAGTWQPPLVTDKMRLAQEEGTITTSIRGNHVSITVKLRRTWAVMLGAGNEGEFQEAFQFLRRLWHRFDCACKVGVCCAVLYLAGQFVRAFLSHGVLYTVLTGGN
jgi:hypothetical protein